MVKLRLSAALLVVLAGSLVVAASAGADPTGSKNSFVFHATCDDGLSAPVVVNSSNGQGSGAQNNTTAEWAPAHVVGSNLVFHPTVFNLLFTFTPAGGGEPQSFPQIDSRQVNKTQTTCMVSGSQSDPQGDTFSISGTVGGWFS
jgi:hypothetical protein